MGQTNCPACGATVDVVQDVSTGQMVALDRSPVDDADAKRYTYVASAPFTHPRVAPVAAEVAGNYFRAHECIEHPAA